MAGVDLAGGTWNVVLGLQLVERELLLFTAFWFLLGSVDDVAVDLCWIWLKLTGRARDGRITDKAAAAPLGGRAAVLIAAWREAGVIGITVRHALAVWQQDQFRIYVGCYVNDPASVAAASAAAGMDPRVRIVIHHREGPTTKADCLNRLYSALRMDEAAGGWRYRSIVLHDAEDMVHAAELAAIDAGLDDADFVQLPVRPEPLPGARWIGGHYVEEFTEAHAKVLVVRNALGAAIPAAGVACGFSRDLIAGIAARREAEGQPGPFSAECLTEDYELGVLVWRGGRRSRFIRLRDQRGNLVATRACFPATLEGAVRQKARWIHGIAFQGWDRLGWSTRWTDLWMALRDRRGPLTAIVLTCGYALVVIEGLLVLANQWLPHDRLAISPVLEALLYLCLVSFLWRSLFRFGFTASEYGLVEGLRALARMPVANFVAILAGRRALHAYIKVLRGQPVRWDKTEHDAHPALHTSAMAPR